MYVLMDLEWYMTELQFSPVQLAALRITNELVTLDSFYTRIRPAFKEDVKFDSVAFTKGSSQQFLKAPNAVRAIRNFANWLKPDDVLLWWHEDAATVFAQLWRDVTGKPVEPMGVLRHELLRCFPHPIKGRKSLYSLASACSGGALFPEHYAKNDVGNILKVLIEAGNPASYYIAMGCVERQERFPGEDLWPSALRWGFSVYRSTGSQRQIVHLRECGCLRNTPADSLIRYANIQESLEDHCRICEKCSPLNKAYTQEMRQIRSFCASEKLNIKKEGQTIHIISRYDVWRILADPVTGKLALYHRNDKNRSVSTSSPDMSNFHRQRYNPASIMEGLTYIARHDQYAEKREQKKTENLYKSTGSNPVHRNSKKGRQIRRKEERRQRRKSLSRVLALIDELSVMKI